MPHEVVRTKEHSRSRSLGWLGVRWIEHFVIHGPGDIQGRPLNIALPDAIPLSDELTMLTVDCYALDVTGSRLYDSAFFSRPKGADKSGHAARFGLFEALGPCRFAGWAEGTRVFSWGKSKGEVFEWMDFRYEYERGEPMGRVVTYPFLRILATEEGQTGNVYDSIYYNLKEGPLKWAFTRGDDVGLTRIYLPEGGEIRPSTASSAAKDGGKESWTNFDETHLYVLPELRNMYKTVRRNMAKRKDAEPWSFETSTMYEPGRDSVAEGTHEMAKLIRDKKIRLSRLFFDHREAPADTDIYNEASLRRGLDESYGDAISYMPVDRLLSEIWDIRNDVADSRRYFLNQVTAAHDAWITPQQWGAIARPGYTVQPGVLITLGLDPSDTNDHTVLTGCEVETGFEWPLAIFDPELCEDHRIPKPALDKAVRDAFEGFDVVGFYSDVHPLEDYIDRWTVDFGEQLCARASERQPIKWYMNREIEATKMVEAYHTAILSGVDISHPGNAAFTQYHINCRRRPNNHGVTFAKGLQKDKIDGAASAALARKARQDYLALPENKKRQVRRRIGVYFT